MDEEQDEKQAVARPAGSGRFATAIEMGELTILADEPKEVGGDESGPTPYQLLAAALAACTSMTMRLYARGKGWDLPDFEIAVTHRLVGEGERRDLFDRRILFRGPVPQDRFERLVDIADRCPVHRTLERTSEIVTTANPPAPPAAEPAGEHVRQMEQACAEEG